MHDLGKATENLFLEQAPPLPLLLHSNYRLFIRSVAAAVRQQRLRSVIWVDVASFGLCAYAWVCVCERDLYIFFLFRGNSRRCSIDCENEKLSCSTRTFTKIVTKRVITNASSLQKKNENLG